MPSTYACTTYPPRAPRGGLHDTPGGVSTRRAETQRPDVQTLQPVAFERLLKRRRMIGTLREQEANRLVVEPTRHEGQHFSASALLGRAYSTRNPRSRAPSIPASHSVVLPIPGPPSAREPAGPDRHPRTRAARPAPTRGLRHELHFPSRQPPHALCSLNQCRPDGWRDSTKPHLPEVKVGDLLALTNDTSAPAGTCVRYFNSSVPDGWTGKPKQVTPQLHLLLSADVKH